MVALENLRSRTNAAMGLTGQGSGGSLRTGGAGSRP